MARPPLNKIALAAFVMLAPGGFILGAALAASYLRDREARSRARTGVTDTASQSDPDAGGAAL